MSLNFSFLQPFTGKHSFCKINIRRTFTQMQLISSCPFIGHNAAIITCQIYKSCSFLNIPSNVAGPTPAAGPVKCLCNKKIKKKQSRNQLLLAPCVPRFTAPLYFYKPRIYIRHFFPPSFSFYFCVLFFFFCPPGQDKYSKISYV